MQGSAPEPPPAGTGMGDVRAAVRAAARARGFVHCGFAAVQPVPHEARLRAWLGGGKAAGMGYLAKGLDRRLDPSRILAGVRTVITLAYPYTPPPPPEEDWRRTLRGRIAGYAAGLDYHHVLQQRLDQVAAVVESLHAPGRTLTYVDTGAILEREWAALGGTGWFGKNTMLLHRLHGSWFFLGEILTQLALEPDPPVGDHCGTCTRCLDDCPTGALEGGYSLDARLCISYLTIENRGPIPRPLRSRLENWVFGCDVCQEVCPWNGDAAAPTPAVAILRPDLVELLALDEARFRSRYHHTALWRARRDGIARNAAVALGNSGNPDAVPHLGRALRQDASGLVRGHAAWALGAIGGRLARAVLEGSRGDVDEAVREEVEAALA